MALSLDGSAHLTGATASAPTITLTTSNSNDIIYLGIVSNAAVTSVSGGGLTWNARASTNAAGNFVTSYYAIAASPLSSAVITINMASSTYVTADIFGISGADTASPFDSGGPQTNASGPASITTANANDFVVGIVLNNQNQGTGWTIIPASVPTDFQMSEYRIESSTGTFTANDSGGGATMSIADAVKQASAGDAFANSQQIIFMRGWRSGLFEPVRQLLKPRRRPSWRPVPAFTF